MAKRVIIVGAGQAGFSVASTLRKLEFDGEVTLIGNEASPPYQRPPLSKAFLKGELELERLYFKPSSYYSDHDITLRTGVTVSGIDRRQRTIATSDGPMSYDHLVLATGSSPRRLPEHSDSVVPDRIYYLRCQEDSRALGAALTNTNRLLVVGGGYIGLEVAAVAASAGVTVTIIEATPRILQRVAAEATSDYFRNLQQNHGVEICEQIGLERIEGSAAKISALLTDGTQREFDTVLVGIGAFPNDQLAREAGLDINNGICVDACCRTSDPQIWAAGDCCSFEVGRRRVRLESVQNAVDQGELVAENIAGNECRYDFKPWFWSDQFDAKLQIAGLNIGYDQIRCRASANGGLSVWYYEGPKFLAVDAINDPRSYMIGRKLLEKHIDPPIDKIEDTDFDLRSLLSI